MDALVIVKVQATELLEARPRKTPILTPAQAATRLAEYCLPFVFYTEPDTRRGNLIYRRYDGDVGLITPSGAEPSGPGLSRRFHGSTPGRLMADGPAAS